MAAGFIVAAPVAGISGRMPPFGRVAQNRRWWLRRDGHCPCSCRSIRRWRVAGLRWGLAVRQLLGSLLVVVDRNAAALLAAYGCRCYADVLGPGPAFAGRLGLAYRMWVVGVRVHRVVNCVRQRSLLCAVCALPGVISCGIVNRRWWCGAAW